MLSFRPALTRARSRFRSPGPLLALAAEVRELEPGTTFECQPAIALPGELDRVREFFGRAEDQVPRLLANVRTEGPTLSYRFSDALLADFTVYCGGRYEVYRSGGKRPVLAGRPDFFDEVQLCTSNCVATYFGHFLTDGLPLEVLARERGMPGVTFRANPWAHEPDYRRILGLPAFSTGHARVRDLWLVDERALNGGWAKRFGSLKSRLRDAVRPAGHRHVFIRRGRFGKPRNLLNEDDIAERLVAMGFVEIAPETMAVEDIATQIAAAEVVVTVEGSAQTHALLAMGEGSTLISIQPPDRFNSIGKLTADPFGIRFGFTVAASAANGFHLEFDRLRRTLDLIP